MKALLKTFYTYIFNFRHIIKFKKFGKGAFLGRRTVVHNAGKKSITISDGVRIGNDARLSCYKVEDHSAEIIIERGCYIGSNFSILTGDLVKIEEDVLIASYVNILGENHGMDALGAKYSEQELTTAPVVIKKGSWIGQNVTILAGNKGITIGERSIIGAGSVVTKDVEDYTIVAGNPAKIIKRFDFDEKNWKSV